MHICFDASAALHQGAGIGRYGREMIPRLRALLDPDEHLSLFTNDARRVVVPAALAALPRYSIPLGNKPWRLRVVLGYLLRRGEEAMLPSTELFFAADHLLPYLPRIQRIINVRDLSYLTHPAYHSLPAGIFQRRMMPLFVRHANHIIVPSLATRRDLEHYYHVPTSKITIIAEGVDDRYRTPIPADTINALRQRLRLPARYILHVGTFEPRKNVMGLLDAFTSLAHDPALADVALVLAGNPGWRYQATLDHLAALQLGERVRRIGRVEESDLPALYAGATVFAFPSWYEGFGLPPLEAMASGTPVVAAAVASLPEVIGDAGLLVAPGDSAGIAAALRALLERPALHARLQAEGRTRAAHFTWERTASATVKVWRGVREK